MLLPIWLNLLLTISSYVITIYLGLLLLNLKRRYAYLILIALIAAIINIGLEYWLNNPFAKVIIPVLAMICLHTYLSKINIYKSAIAIIIGVDIYYFIESIALLISYNFLKILPEIYLDNQLVNIFGILFIVCIGLGIIVLIKTFNWNLYNLAQIAENSRQNKSILIALLLFIGMPLLIYCFIIWFSIYTINLSVDNITLILNIANMIFLIYFFINCFALTRAEYALEKNFKNKANSNMVALLQKFFETQFQPQEDLSSSANNIADIFKQHKYAGTRPVLYSINNSVKPEIPVDLIPISTLRLFFQIEYALAQERKVDFILHVSDLSELAAYVDDAFIRMLKNLYENAFEAVESAEFKEIYSEITKDDDGGFTIIIKNNGDILPKGHQNQPFELGYTTKNSPDRGYGLCKVKKLIDHYQGSIDLRGSDGYTQVIIKLPFKDNYSTQAQKREQSMLMLVKNDKEGR